MRQVNTLLDIDSEEIINGEKIYTVYVVDECTKEVIQTIKIKQISFSHEYAFVIDIDNRLLCIGNEYCKQFSKKDTNDERVIIDTGYRNVKKVVCTPVHTYITDENGDFRNIDNNTY